MNKKLFLIVSLFSFSTGLFAQLDRSIVPEAQPNPIIKIEIPNSLTYGNGLEVIMVENHKQPKVSFQLFIDYPDAMEGDKAGLSHIFGQMLESGTVNNPKDAFDEKIDYMGASFFPNSRGFYASSLKKHTPKLLSLLSEVLTTPSFTQEDFDRVIAQNLSNLASLPSDAKNISSNIVNVVNHGNNHPYGEIMTEETLNNITLDDIKAFHKKNFIPNNAYLIIVGDVSQEDTKEYIHDYFENWKKGANLKKQDFIIPTTKGKNVYFVNKPGAVQSVISITNTLKLAPGHSDEIKLSVLNSILGGGSFSARLMSNLREDKAYTYGCYSTIESDPLIGSFYAGGSFRNEVTDSAIVQILAEIETISESLVTDQEIDLVKKSMTGAFARSLENPQTVARFALNTIRYNLPSDYYSSYLLKLERITKQDLLMVASEYLTPQNINIVVVGNNEISEKLAVFDTDGKVEFKNYYGQEEEQIRNVADEITAESIIDEYIFNIMMVSSKEELAEKLTKVKQIETIGKAEFKAMSAEIIAYNALGTTNKTASYVLIKTPMGSQVGQKEWFDGENGSTVSPMGITVYEEEELADKKKPNFPVAQINHFKNPALTIDLLGIVDIDDVPYYKIKIAEKENISYEYYNVETGLLVLKESFEIDENGNETSGTIKYTNYTEYSGLFLPKNTEITTQQQGQSQTMNFEVVQRKVGKKVKSKAFSGNFKKVEKIISKL